MYFPIANLLPRLLVPGFIVLAVSACASGDVAAIKAASQDAIRGVVVSEVNVSFDTPRPYPGLRAALADELHNIMPRCAAGAVSHRMDVIVKEFEDQNVAQTLLIGDEIELGGIVKLIDVSSGVVTGEYYVRREFFWGGLIGAAMMSDAEVSLSKRFAQSVCEEVFGVNPNS